MDDPRMMTAEQLDEIRNLPGRFETIAGKAQRESDSRRNNGTGSNHDNQRRDYSEGQAQAWREAAKFTRAALVQILSHVVALTDRLTRAERERSELVQAQIDLAAFARGIERAADGLRQERDAAIKRAEDAERRLQEAMDKGWSLTP